MYASRRLDRAGYYLPLWFNVFSAYNQKTKASDVKKKEKTKASRTTKTGK